MRKILVVANRMDCGGTEVAALSIINSLLKDRDNNITLLLNKAEGVWLNRVPQSVKIVEYVGPRSLKEVASTCSGFGKLKFYCRYIWRKIRSIQNYDLLLSYVDDFADEFDTALDVNGYSYFLTAYVAKKVHAKRKATWFHDEELGWMFKIESYLTCFDKLYCVSKAVQIQLEKRAPEFTEKTEVLYNPIDVKTIREKAEESIDNIFQPNKVNVLTVGRIHPQKGITMIIEIAKILKMRKVPFVWFLIGDGEMLPEYKQKCNEESVSDVVIFLGQKDNPYPYMAACDIYVQPSLHEGYGLTILEARALKKLIIASDLPCFREQIENGINGYLCNQSADEFASCIENVIRAPKDKIKQIAERESKVDFTSEIDKLYKIL